MTQYELFREELVPAFCVLAYDDLQVRPLARSAARGKPNAWGLAGDVALTVRGAPDIDPPGPSPACCCALGGALAAALRDGPHRVARVASSSWSHAFLVDKAWHLRPDTAADRELDAALAAGDYGSWLEVTTEDVVAAGQHEMLNWCCLLGAMAELGCTPSWATLVETEVFNSNTCSAVFDRPR